jgi:hypothetical protein
MPDTTTTNYAWVKPEVGASSDTWGGKINATFDAIDTRMKTTTDLATAASAAASNAILRVNGTVPGGNAANGQIKFDTSAPAATSDSPHLLFQNNNGSGGLNEAGRIYGNAGALYISAIASVFTGSVTATVFSTSDRRLKTNLRPIDGGAALERMLALGGYSYIKNQQPERGVIAQHVQAVGLGDLVTAGPDKMLAVNYTGLIAELIAALGAVHARLKALEVDP